YAALKVRLLTWCQRHTEGYRNVCVSDLTSSWKSGLALCALIHNFRADLIDFDSLNEEESAKNNQMAFDIAEREFGIPSRDQQMPLPQSLLELDDPSFRKMSHFG
uniref:Calponin-homology (CH) domain-containing protein n=1 Tax=Paramormyrops kingsleyae TaxID=1676925 RepID=A0A3B3SF84_9TELE